MKKLKKVKQQNLVTSRSTEHLKNSNSIDFENGRLMENRPTILKCTKCGEEKHGLDFYKCDVNSKRNQGICVDCSDKKRKYNRNKEKYRQGEGVFLSAKTGCPVNTHDEKGNKYNNLTNFLNYEPEQLQLIWD